MGAARRDQPADLVPFVAAEIVEYDDIARRERRCEDAFDMDAEDAPFMGRSMTNGATIPTQRRAATKVVVFQCPCGTRPIRRVPRRRRP